MEKDDVEKKSSTVSVGRIVMNTIRKYEGSNGISLRELKKILRETKKLDIALHDSEIKLALKNAMDRAILSREGGSYKVVKAKARAKSSSKDDEKTRRTKKEAIKVPKRNSSAKSSSKDDKKTRRTKKEAIKVPKRNSSAKKPAKSSSKDDKKTRRTKKEAIKVPKSNSSAKKPAKRDGKKG